MDKSLSGDYIKKIEFKDTLIAIIIKNTYHKPGIHFLTSADYSQQLGFMSHPKGKIITPHVHCIHERAINVTQEVLFIRRGKLRVDFYSENQIYIESQILEAGDVILLITAGHGFEVLEDVEMIEVKQGPYCINDKIQFSSVDSSKIIIR